MQRADSLEKTLMLGGIGGRRNRGWQRMRWLDVIIDSMDVSLSELQELTQTHVHWVGDSIQSPHPLLILCHPVFLPPSVFPSIRIFSNESALHIRWPKYWSFSFNISPSNEHSGLISFTLDCLDLFAVQGTVKSLLQQHSSKASFFGAQLSLYSNSHIHTWLLEKNIALTRWTFVSKVMSLFFNILSRLVITFLPRSKHLWI